MAKTLRGVISSKSGDKTIVITVQSRKTHPIYKKNYTVTDKFMAHDEKNEGQVGDTVSIIESRPISRRKRFTLLKVIERPVIREQDKVEALESPVEDLPKKEVKENVKKVKADKAEVKADNEEEES